MLDTNICIHLLNRSKPRLSEQVISHPPGDLAMSVVTAAELAFGAQKSERKAKSLERLRLLRSEIAALSFDAAAVDAYGEIRAALERRGTPIGPLDTLIAAHALALGLTLVTNNVGEFRRVKGLEVEDWAS